MSKSTELSLRGYVKLATTRERLRQALDRAVANSGNTGNERDENRESQIRRLPKTLARLTAELEAFVEAAQMAEEQAVREGRHVQLSPETREQLRALGYRKPSARPRHPRQDVAAQEAFKKTSPPSWQRLPQRSSAIGR